MILYFLSQYEKCRFWSQYKPFSLVCINLRYKRDWLASNFEITRGFIHRCHPKTPNSKGTLVRNWSQETSPRSQITPLSAIAGRQRWFRNSALLNGFAGHALTPHPFSPQSLIANGADIGRSRRLVSFQSTADIFQKRTSWKLTFEPKLGQPPSLT